MLLAAQAGQAAPDAGPIRAGSELDYPPFATVKPDGSADGFSVELLAAALKAMGRSVEFEVAPWHELKRGLADGRLQVLPLMARSPERQAQFDFSVPYFTMHGTVVVRKGDDRIRDVHDLRGREVIVMRDDIADEYVRSRQIAGKIIRTDSVEQALQLLALGKHDAVVVQKLAGKALIHSLGLKNLEVVGPPITEYQQFCFAVREGDVELLALINEGLALVVADGTFAELQHKWLSPVQEERPPYLLLAIAVTITLALAWAIALFWQRSLLRLVHQRTSALRDANLTLMHEIHEHHATEQALRRTTEELEAMFSNVHMNLAVLDRRLRFVRVNAAYAANVHRCPQELIGQGHFELFPHAENEAIFRRVLETGETYSVTAKPFHHPDQPERGTTYWDWTLTPLRDVNGGVDGVILALIDVTERERQRQEKEIASRRSQELLELRVQERTSELRQAYEELESFSYSVSHDLRGPLRAINGFSQALAEDFNDSLHPEGRAYIARIRNGTLRMGELIDGLLNLANVFRSEIRFSEVNLSTLAHEIVVMLIGSEAGCTAEFRIQPHMTTLGDPTLLRVLLQNLLGNALKFSRHRPAPLIEFGVTEQEGTKVYFVRDNGMGFDMQYAHKLFQPFERLHDGDRFEGTGIGLATVRRVILRHRGRVWAEGTPDQGATVYFSLGIQAVGSIAPDTEASTSAG